MVSCPDSAPPPFTCPTLEQSIQATAALLPRGKAWPANDGGATITAYLAWLAGLAGIPAAADWPAGFVQVGFVAALGTVRNWIETRFCDLRDEFFCDTASETLDLWNAEYGLPDQCDPFPNLCAKVGTIGGTPTCAFWTGAAAALGWSIACSDFLQGAGAQFGTSQFGTSQFGTGIQPTVIDITVLLAESPAYAAPLDRPPVFGAMQFGSQFDELPNIAPLTCAFDRIMPAHLTINYTTVDE